MTVDTIGKIVLVTTVLQIRKENVNCTAKVFESELCSAGKSTDLNKTPDLINFCITRNILNNRTNVDKVLDTNSDHSLIHLITHPKNFETVTPCEPTNITY